jgi:hypothetical protein
MTNNRKLLFTCWRHGEVTLLPRIRKRACGLLACLLDCGFVCARVLLLNKLDSWKFPRGALVVIDCGMNGTGLTSEESSDFLGSLASYEVVGVLVILASGHR